MLRMRPKLPCPPAELRCWAFNPPGGLLSWELSQIAQAYCTSIVVGKDVISRLRWVPFAALTCCAMSRRTRMPAARRFVAGRDAISRLSLVACQSCLLAECHGD